jgi:anti-sigma-K factor RskA
MMTMKDDSREMKQERDFAHDHVERALNARRVYDRERRTSDSAMGLARDAACWRFHQFAYLYEGEGWAGMSAIPWHSLRWETGSTKAHAGAGSTVDECARELVVAAAVLGTTVEYEVNGVETHAEPGDHPRKVVERWQRRLSELRSP